MTELTVTLAPGLTLMHGDCMEYLATLPDGAFDLILTSPPYNLGGDFHTMKGGKRATYGAYSSYGDNMPESDYQEWQISLMKEWFRVLSPNGSLFYNHKVRIKDGCAIHPLSWILKTDFVLKQEITVDLAGTCNVDKRRFFPAAERVYWLTKNANVDIYNSANLTDIWRVPSDNNRDKSGHPAVMPVKMASIIIEATRPKTIFDPFGGYGTTAMAAIDAGCACVCTEIDRDYFNAAVERISKRLAQPFLPGIAGNEGKGQAEQVKLFCGL